MSDDDETWPWAAEFTPTGTHLATASMGLPPRATTAALDRVLDLWARGEVTAATFDVEVEAAREVYARLVGVTADRVAIGHQVSPLVGMIAASLPAGAEVVVPALDYGSLSAPFAAQAGRGIGLREVPLDRLAESVTPGTHLVAFSLVQSRDGRIVDAGAVARAAAEVGARTLVDTTQAVGWYPVDADRFDWTVCSAYKWLLSPRGTAFLTARPERWDEVVPLAAGPFAGEPDHREFYGADVPRAATARRFDVSPAWQAWVGTRASLEFVDRIGVPALHAHAVACERAFAGAAGLEPTGSAIVAVEASDNVAALLESERISTTTRAGRLRLAFHADVTVAEARRVGALLRGRVRP